VIPGAIWLAGAEREPDRDANAAKVDAAGKDHECGRPDRMRGRRARYPSPAATERDPTAIVKGSVAPGLIFDPNPAPGRMVNPVAIVVGRPAGRDVVGKPDGAVFGSRLPFAIGVQLGRAGDLGAYVAVGDGMGNLPVALLAPGVEAVWIGDLQPLRIDRIGAGEFKGLPTTDVLLKSTRAGDQQVVREIGEDGSAIAGQNVDTEFTGLGEGCAAAGGVDEDRLAPPQAVGADANGALGDAERDAVGGGIDKGYVAVGPDAHIVLTDLDFGAAV